MAAPPPVGESVLVVNAGSSSLKVKAYPAGVRLHVERIGERGGHTHETALEECLARLAGEGGDYAPAVVGHRVVHGGTRYTASRVTCSFAPQSAAISSKAALADVLNAFPAG